jgi:hypothetical protein
MHEYMKEYGFPGIFLLMSVKYFFEMVSSVFSKIKESESNESNGSSEALKEYRLEAAIGQLSENMIRQTAILERMQDDHRDHGQIIASMNEKLSRIRDTCAIHKS